MRTDPRVATRVATEYCAWIYYTPEHKFEMSMLADQPSSDDVTTGKRSCNLPAFVKDERYPRDALKYIFSVHNHPFGTSLSSRDLRFAEAMASLHSWFVETKSNKVLLSVIAFFSRSEDPERPTCDGFFQYIPATSDMLKWTQDSGVWKREALGVVTWIDENNYRIDKPR